MTQSAENDAKPCPFGKPHPPHDWVLFPNGLHPVTVTCPGVTPPDKGEA